MDELVDMLGAEIRRDKHVIRAQRKEIERLQNLLTANGIAVTPTVVSFALCKAANDQELCPLALLPINSCGPPFVGCCDVLDPLHPAKRCAQLVCGHRFNAVWIMFHFVRNSTTRCPICRQGSRRFRFGPDSVPPCMLLARQ